jgi:hypothetical protein
MLAYGIVIGLSVLTAIWGYAVGLKVGTLRARGHAVVDQWSSEQKAAYLVAGQAELYVDVPLIPIMLNPFRDDINPHIYKKGWPGWYPEYEIKL